MFPEYRWLVQIMLEIRAEYVVLVVTESWVQMGLLVKNNVQVWQVHGIGRLKKYVADSIVS
jgi:hypothetical protein